MKNRILAALTAVPLVALAFAAAAPQSDRYMGEVMDSSCAAQGSHTAMMRKEGTATAKECTLACMKGGSALVLHNAASHWTYQLDDQAKARDFAGSRVRVTGHLDPDTKTIHVERIETQ